ncbi:A24 family peptidase C-terminal domain-containing protein [Candidatus Alkanophaga liquidiphilum]|nr:Flp pilus assembly protein [Candidatus Alkanophaga liquidiphilum]RLG38217.1 MAG: hypothetical protein DRN91_03310 [Candidatus Alkanophagales archaeon]
MSELELLRFCVGGALLLYASYVDVKTREISDAVWALMAAFGVAFLALDFSYGVLQPFQVLRSVLTASVLALLLLLLNFGGADAKALLAISVLLPSFPAFAASVPPLNVFVLSVLTNALILSLSTPLVLFFYNAFKGNFSPLMFLGYKVKVSELRAKKHIKLMHELRSFGGAGEGSGAVSGYELRYVWGGIEPSEGVLKLLERSGLSEAWVTPQMPFLVYLTVGFFIAAAYGDIVFNLLT